MYICICADIGKGVEEITLNQGMDADFKWSSVEEAFILTCHTAKYVFKIILYF